MRATARCLIAIISICAWLATSNHCVVTALVTKPHATGCPFHFNPTKPKSQPIECCKILRAVANAPAKNLAPAIVDLPPCKFGEILVSAPPRVFLAPAMTDTGPPGKTSFTELSRSLRAHAPPFFA